MKILIILLSPLFFSPLDFEKFQFPPDFVEFKNPVPQKGGGSVRYENSPEKRIYVAFRV